MLIFQGFFQKRHSILGMMVIAVALLLWNLAGQVSKDDAFRQQVGGEGSWELEPGKKNQLLFIGGKKEMFTQIWENKMVAKKKSWVSWIVFVSFDFILWWTWPCRIKCESFVVVHGPSKRIAKHLRFLQAFLKEKGSFGNTLSMFCQVMYTVHRYTYLYIFTYIRQSPNPISLFMASWNRSPVDNRSVSWALEICLPRTWVFPFPRGSMWGECVNMVVKPQSFNRSYSKFSQFIVKYLEVVLHFWMNYSDVAWLILPIRW